MKRLSLVIPVFLVIAAPTFAGTITTVACSITGPGGGFQTQTDPNSASCDLLSGPPLSGQSAVANGTVTDGGMSMSGYAEVCCSIDVFASSDSSFTESLTVPTILSWSLSANVGGEWSSVFLSDGIANFASCQGAININGCSNSGTIALSPGDYTFSMSVYDSEEGNASGSGSFGLTSPEPGTVGLVASVLLLGLCRKLILKFFCHSNR